MSKLFSCVTVLIYAVELMAHYDWHYKPEWTDAELICTGLVVVAVTTLLTSRSNDGPQRRAD